MPAHPASVRLRRPHALCKPEPMEDESQQVIEQTTEVALSLWDRAQDLLTLLLRPWNAYQVAIALALFIVAFCLSLYLAPRIRAALARREGWPKWQLRLILTGVQRLRAILFVILIWIAVYYLRETTWPSRSYILSIIANLATAWLIVQLASRLIRSPSLRRLVKWSALIWISLRILGLMSEVENLLDAAALDFGDTRLSLLMIVQGVVVLGVLFFVARFLSGTTHSRLEKSEDMSPSMRVLVLKVAQVGFYGAALFLGMRAIGFDLTGLAVLSGAIGVGLGFGLQKVVSNLVSGVIILLDKSIKPGDVISLGKTFGWINALGARYVSVVTRNGKEYLIPNEDLITGQVVNWSHSNDYVRLDINFGTAYDDDPHKVRALAIEAAKSVDRVLSYRDPVCHIVGFGDSSVDYILRFWIKDPTGGLTNIRGNVFLALWDIFQANDISIPFPQREVRMLEDAPEPETKG